MSFTILRSEKSRQDSAASLTIHGPAMQRCWLITALQSELFCKVNNVGSMSCFGCCCTVNLDLSIDVILLCLWSSALNWMSVLDFFFLSELNEQWLSEKVQLVCFFFFFKPVPAGSCRCVHDNRINRFVYYRNIMLPLCPAEHWEIKTACQSQSVWLVQCNLVAFVKQCDCVFGEYTWFYVHYVSVCRSW